MALKGAVCVTVLCAHRQHWMVTLRPMRGERSSPRVTAGVARQRVAVVCSVHVEKWVERDRETCNVESSTLLCHGRDV